MKAVLVNGAFLRMENDERNLETDTKVVIAEAETKEELIEAVKAKGYYAPTALY